MANEVRVLVNYGGPRRVRAGGFNRLIDGPTWGLGAAARTIAEAAKGHEYKISIPEYGFTRLESRLCQLNILSISFPQGITAGEVKSDLRRILYTSHLSTLKGSDPQRSSYGDYLKEVIGHPGLDEESIANLLARFPMTMEQIGTRTVVTERSDYPGTGSRYLEAGTITDTSEEAIFRRRYTEDQIGLVKDLLASLEAGKREIVIALLQTKNSILHAIVAS